MYRFVFGQENTQVSVRMSDWTNQRNQAEFPQRMIIFPIEPLFHGMLPRGTIRAIAQ